MADTNWVLNDVTTAAPGAQPPAAGGPLAGWTIAPGVTLPEVYYIDASNHVCELAYDGSNWHFNDVTAAAPGALPAAAGSPLAATDVTLPESLPEVYFIDASNHVCELAYDGSNWHFNDVTSAVQDARPPAAGSPLAVTSIGTSGSILPEVYFIDASNHVRELAYGGKNWRTTDLTRAASDPPYVSPAAGSPLAATGITTSGTTPVYLPEVYYTDANNHVCELSWTGGPSGYWQFTDVTAEVPGAPPPAPDSPLTPASITIEPGFRPRVYFIDASNHHVCELAYDGSNWQFTDVTAVAPGAQPWATGSALAAWFITSDLLPEVYFTDASNHVCELSWTGGPSGYWQFADVTSAAHAPDAAAGSPLAAWAWSADWLPEVYFIDANNQVRELAFTGMGTQNWMGSVDGSKYLSQLSIPGTHDTLTYSADLAAQDQDSTFNIAAQLNAGIRFFDLRLEESKADLNNPYEPGPTILVGIHDGELPNTGFWANILTPTTQFLQANPTECVIYSVTNCGQTFDITPDDPTWAETFISYMSVYGPRDYEKSFSWGVFYTSTDASSPLPVPTLDQVRGKIVLALAAGPAADLGAPGYGLDFSKDTTLTLQDGTPVALFTQPIYDDGSGKNAMSDQTISIQNFVQEAAANTDPANWYFIWTNRSNGEPTSKFFATGWSAGQVPLPYPQTFEGYNTVALDQINQVCVTGHPDQRTVGLVISDFPNDTSGYIDAIIARNPGLP